MPRPRTDPRSKRTRRLLALKPSVFLSGRAEEDQDPDDPILRNPRWVCPKCGEYLFFESEINSAGERGWLCPARFDGAHK